MIKNTPPILHFESRREKRPSLALRAREGATKKVSPHRKQWLGAHKAGRRLGAVVSRKKKRKCPLFRILSEREGRGWCCGHCQHGLCQWVLTWASRQVVDCGCWCNLVVPALWRTLVWNGWNSSLHLAIGARKGAAVMCCVVAVIQLRLQLFYLYNCFKRFIL